MYKRLFNTLIYYTLLFLSVSASAATITHVNPVSLSFSPIDFQKEVSVSIPQFNPLWGTLTKVTRSFSSGTMTASASNPFSYGHYLEIRAHLWGRTSDSLAYGAVYSSGYESFSDFAKDEVVTANTTIGDAFVYSPALYQPGLAYFTGSGSINNTVLGQFQLAGTQRLNQFHGGQISSNYAIEYEYIPHADALDPFFEEAGQQVKNNEYLVDFRDRALQRVENYENAKEIVDKVLFLKKLYTIGTGTALERVEEVYDYVYSQWASESAERYRGQPLTTDEIAAQATTKTEAWGLICKVEGYVYCANPAHAAIILARANAAMAQRLINDPPRADFEQIYVPSRETFTPELREQLGDVLANYIEESIYSLDILEGILASLERAQGAALAGDQALKDQQIETFNNLIAEFNRHLEEELNPAAQAFDSEWFAILQNTADDLAELETGFGGSIDELIASQQIIDNQELIMTTLTENWDAMLGTFQSDWDQEFIDLIGGFSLDGFESYMNELLSIDITDPTSLFMSAMSDQVFYPTRSEENAVTTGEVPLPSVVWLMLIGFAAFRYLSFKKQ